MRFAAPKNNQALLANKQKLVCASLSHLFAGDAIGNVLTPLVLTAVLIASWWLRPEGRTLNA